MVCADDQFCNEDDVVSDEIIMPFSGLPEKDLRNLVAWIISIEKETGLGAEAIDCIISELKEGNTVGAAQWFACCEWDL